MAYNQQHESINFTVERFIKQGVNPLKIIQTENPSVVNYSKTRKCLVGGTHQPPAIEFIKNGDGNLKATYENNAIISLLNRSELTISDIDEINESNGIVVTNATYGKPYFRYGFIPR